MHHRTQPYIYQLLTSEDLEKTTIQKYQNCVAHNAKQTKTRHNPVWSH